MPENPRLLSSHGKLTPQGRFCLKKNEIGLPLAKAFQTHGPIQRRGFADMLLKVLHYLTRRIKSPDS